MPAPQSYVTLTLPHGLVHAEGSASPYEDIYNVYDFALGGVPFLSDASADNPFVRGSADFKRDQFDNSTEPGEQSLTGWWLRSQSSWHLGTGIKNSDVALDESAQFRFADSQGINPWVPGELTLLKQTETAAAAGGFVACLGVSISDVDYVLFADGNGLYLVDSSHASTPITWGGSGGIQSITSDGQNWYASSTDGIYWGALSGGAGEKLWDVSASNTLVRWVKSRIVAAVDNSLYELVPGMGTPPITLPDPVYTHAVDAFIWTDIADGPIAIYAIGYYGTDSSVLKLTIDTQGALPTLDLATTAAELPRNEVGTALYSYLGAFMIMGTNRGVRVAVIGPNGDLEYGPLIETPFPVYDCVAQDHFVWAGYSGGFADDMSGALRIDLSAPLGNGRYPWASDLATDSTGVVRGLTTLGTSNRIVIAVESAGLYYESADSYVESGSFVTGRVRYNTLWPKLYKQYNIRGTLNGPITIASIDATGNEVQLASVSSDNQQAEDLPINYPSGPQEFVSFRFTLGRDPADMTSTPVMRGYQVKALPAGPRPRQYVVPLRCADFEVSETGAKVGYKGYGLSRLELIEAMDSAGDAVLFQDLRNGTATRVTIERIEFRQIVPPQPNRSIWGGSLGVVLRTLN